MMIMIMMMNMIFVMMMMMVTIMMVMIMMLIMMMMIMILIMVIMMGDCNRWLYEPSKAAKRDISVVLDGIFNVPIPTDLHYCAEYLKGRLF